MSAEETRKDADDQARAQLASIREMMAELKAAEEAGEEAGDYLSAERARDDIICDALSVEVRSDWYTLGNPADRTPVEFRILLCTGGPAVQIWGKLDEYGQPDRNSLELQSQGWFIPWQAVKGLTGEDLDALAAYCSCFYFGDV